MSKEFKSIHIDIENDIYQINGEDASKVSYLELIFNKGLWSMFLTKDESCKYPIPQKQGAEIVCESQYFDQEQSWRVVINRGVPQIIPMAAGNYSIGEIKTESNYKDRKEVDRCQKYI